MHRLSLYWILDAPAMKYFDSKKEGAYLYPREKVYSDF